MTQTRFLPLQINNKQMYNEYIGKQQQKGIVVDICQNQLSMEVQGEKDTFDKSYQSNDSQNLTQTVIHGADSLCSTRNLGRSSVEDFDADSGKTNLNTLINLNIVINLNTPANLSMKNHIRFNNIVQFNILCSTKHNSRSIIQIEQLFQQVCGRRLIELRGLFYVINFVETKQCQACQYFHFAPNKNNANNE
ncbi:Hypothetical_protein [Hexamita inflata]|uniref:Hypothetical_protein n=1 Tax=Hexamita inflata TaxID=28002 RepID=A0AA86T9M1_9EUKA|nr:Hypothetical protein HINF_LOCUS45 [Hexamita inflata]